MKFRYLFGLAVLLVSGLIGGGATGALGSSVARPCTTVISTVTSWFTTTVTSTVTTTVGTTTTPPPNGTVPGVAVVKWGAGNFSQVPNPEKLSGCITSINSQPLVANMPCKSLLYINHTNIVYGCCDTGVSSAQMDANNWWLYDSAGNKAHYGCGSNEYLADLSLPGYRQAFINAALNYLDQYPGLEGFYLDNVLGYIAGCTGNLPVKFPTGASYADAQIAFLQAVMPAIRARAYVTANVLVCCDNDGNLNIAWAQRAMPYLDGDSMEYYGYVNGKTRINGTNWDQQWENWQRIVGVVQGLGKDWNPTTTWPTCTDLTPSTYIKASYLLERDGSGFMIGSCPGSYSGTGDPTANWTAPWVKDIGAPLGSKVQLANGVWERDFANGKVFVNPTGSTQTADGHTLTSGTAFIG